MAWNQPIQTRSCKPSKRLKVGVRGMIGLLFIGIIAAAVTITVVIFSNNKVETNGPIETSIVKKPKSIASHPVFTNNVKPTSSAKMVEVKRKHKAGEIWYAEDGTKMATVLKNGEAIDVPVFIPRNRRLPKTHIFSHPSDNQIANLLRLEPGVGTFGDRDYKGFKDAFLKSCEEPIIISEGDDEWTKQLKRDVIDTKIELRARMADGEDVEEIMRETRNEYKKLANIKSFIESEVRNSLLNDDVTSDDMEDLVAAANKFLEDKGIPPLKINPFVQRRILELKKESIDE